MKDKIPEYICANCGHTLGWGICKECANCQTLNIDGNRLRKDCKHNWEILDEGQGYYKVRCIECGGVTYINAYTKGIIYRMSI